MGYQTYISVANLIAKNQIIPYLAKKDNLSWFLNSLKC
jgi:hypothetical protein